MSDGEEQNEIICNHCGSDEGYFSKTYLVGYYLYNSGGRFEGDADEDGCFIKKINKTKFCKKCGKRIKTKESG